MQTATGNVDSHAGFVGSYRGRFARPAIAIVSGLQLLHIVVLFLVPHPVLLSNLLQLLIPLLVAGICLHQSRLSPTAVGRKCWTALAASFGIWSLAELLYIFFLFFPQNRHSGVRIDDALWIAFGLPLLIAMNLTHDEVDSVGRFDRLQAVLFFVVLYLLVFLPSVRLGVDHAFLIQDGALLLCCLLRIPVCRLARERSFFTRLAIFLLLYAPLTLLGDYLHEHGWAPGSAVDLVWTLPSTVFALLILRDAMQTEERHALTGRFVKAIQSMQGLSVATLAFLSTGICVLLAVHHVWLGGTLLVCAFALFALRTNARERAWLFANKRLKDTVLQDALTGLGNRILLRGELRDQLNHGGSGRAITLIFADLDRFKHINDSLGHSCGDELLVQVARRLCASAPSDSVICRQGGDEFVVLTTSATPEEAAAIGERLLASLQPSYRLGAHLLHCTASIGVAMAAVGQDAEELLRTADHAMYRAKQLGKNCVQLFDASLREQMNHRWQIEADLRDCLDANALDIAFQPIVRVGGGEVTGFEALARWTHPQHGAIPPSDFIPLAEDAGLILQLGAQVLEKACAQVAYWNHTWNTRFSLSVNVSPRQLADTTLLSRILEILKRTEFDPELLRLEMTESALLVNENVVRRTLEDARSCGIRISLDDFGTGYSSLAFLLNLPVDEVKVDRSFVSDMHLDPKRRELVRTVVQLGRSLGKRVVAEGVETEQDLRELAAMGCENAQGWLISRPLFAGALEANMPAIQARQACPVQTAQTRPENSKLIPPVEDTHWTDFTSTPVAVLETA